MAPPGVDVTESVPVPVPVGTGVGAVIGAVIGAVVGTGVGTVVGPEGFRETGTDTVWPGRTVTLVE
ncbi:MAG: hypothetical protein GKC05_03105 [Methanomicrobiales archaeon]|nr:hypothetical protein [Methanomicrobiales archaeon]